MRWLGEQEICIVVRYSKNVCSSLMCVFLSQGTMTTHFTNPREENGVSVRPAAQDQCNSLINFLDFIFTFIFFFILCYFLLFINYQTKVLLSEFPFNPHKCQLVHITGPFIGFQSKKHVQ